MLRTFYRLSQLDFMQLMNVYEEGNLENARELYPDDTADAGMYKAVAAFEDYLREAFFRVPGAFYAVWQENGSYCSALRMEPYEDGWLLEALETKPSCRRQGYAMRLITAVLGQLPAGSCVYSHVGKRNSASLAAHRRCGFHQIKDHAKYVDGTVTQYACTMKIML